MTSAFEKLCGPGKPLKAEPPDAKEFAGLRRSGKARLKDASVNGLALESRFDLELEDVPVAALHRLHRTLRSPASGKALADVAGSRDGLAGEVDRAVDDVGHCAASTCEEGIHRECLKEVVGMTTPETACYGAQRRGEKNAFPELEAIPKWHPATQRPRR